MLLLPINILTKLSQVAITCMYSLRVHNNYVYVCGLHISRLMVMCHVAKKETHVP